MTATSPENRARDGLLFPTHDWPDASIWGALAPRSVRKAAGWGNDSPGWKAWRKHLGRRGSAVFVGGDKAQWATRLSWGLSATAADALTAGTIGRLAEWRKQSRRGRSGGEQAEQVVAELRAWLQHDSAGQDRDEALVSLAWAYAAPDLTAALPAELWWELLGELLTTASGAAATLDHAAAAWPLLGIELPLVLAASLPEIENCRRLTAGAIAEWDRAAEELLNDQGLPRNGRLEEMRPLLACWTRCRNLAVAAAPAAATTGRHRALVEQALRWSRPDGTALLTAASRDDAELLRASVATVESRGTRKLSQRAFGTKGPRQATDAAMHAADAGLALLRPGWGRGAACCAAAYAGDGFRMELRRGGEALWSGTLETRVAVDGAPLAAVGPWREVCWESDEQVDYLEVERELAGGARLVRQLLLTRTDRVFFFGDAVLDVTGGQIDYETRFPAAAHVALRPADKTREAILDFDGRPRALVIPLALPEWRSDSRPGTVETCEGGWRLRQSAAGRKALFAPLLFDLRRRRIGRPMTWRQLTVGESREAVSPEAAVGYRAQVGRRQWLVYRSLGPVGNRTVLGHNLIGSFLLARFRRGEVKPYLELE